MKSKKTNKPGLYYLEPTYPNLPPIWKMNQRPDKNAGYEGAKILTKRPRRYTIMGIHEAGKSNLNETIAVNHSHVIDIFGSRDNENLCWARDGSPFSKSVLFICGDNTEIDSSWDFKTVSEVTIQDIERYKAVVTCDRFYSSQETKFKSIEELTSVFYERLSWNQGDIMFLLLREAMSLIYSKQSLGVQESAAKAALLTFLRELRHFGVSFGADSLRWTGIDKEIRDLSDYIFFKQIGDANLPKDKEYLYKFAHPTWFRKMPKDQFLLNCKTGDIATGKLGLLPFHKEEGVNLLAELGITITHGVELEESTNQNVGDKEHADIIADYIQTGSMIQTSENIGRGTGTVSRHVTKHNRDVVQYGVCKVCDRVGAACKNVIVDTSR